VVAAGGGGVPHKFWPSKIENFVRHLQKSLGSMVFSRLTQVCKMIKSIYFVILQQTKTNKGKYYSTYLSRSINNSVHVYAESVALRLITSAIF